MFAWGLVKRRGATRASRLLEPVLQRARAAIAFLEHPDPRQPYTVVGFWAGDGVNDGAVKHALHTRLTKYQQSQLQRMVLTFGQCATNVYNMVVQSEDWPRIFHEVDAEHRLLHGYEDGIFSRHSKSHRPNGKNNKEDEDGRMVPRSGTDPDIIKFIALFVTYIQKYKIEVFADMVSATAWVLDLLSRVLPHVKFVGLEKDKAKHGNPLPAPHVPWYLPHPHTVRVLLTDLLLLCVVLRSCGDGAQGAHGPSGGTSCWRRSQSHVGQIARGKLYAVLKQLASPVRWSHVRCATSSLLRAALLTPTSVCAGCSRRGKLARET